MALAGLPGIEKLVDDILVKAATKEELLERTEKVIKRCQETNITLNSKKIQIGQSVKFGGHIITSEGSSPDPDKVRAIKDFPTPTNVTDVRSFMGLSNQFMDYLPDLKQNLEPIKDLLKKQNAFLWTSDHAKAMEQVKTLITEESSLARFDPNKHLVLITDASKKGLGYVLLQTDNEPEVEEDPRADRKAKYTVKEMPKGQLIACGSRFLSPAEANYAIIEDELLAVQWAVQKLRMYLAGAQFTVITDHAPLTSILNGKNHDAIYNQRIQRISSKLIGYQFKLLYCRGKDNHIADALSRYPIFDPEEDDTKDVLACTVVARRATEVKEEKVQSDLAMEVLMRYAEADQD